MLWWVAILFCGYLAILIGVLAISVRPPRTPNYISPAALDVPFEAVEFTTEDGILLRGWWIEAPGSDRVMILSHGYLMNRSELVPEAVWLYRQGIPSLTYDLRAHGRSRGKLSSMGPHEARDVRAAVQFSRLRVPGARFGLLGSSMGAAASAFFAAEEPGVAEVLVLDSAYSKQVNAIDGWWRFIGGRWLAWALKPTAWLSPLFGLYPARADVAAALAKLPTLPVLILHGTRDDLALPSEAERNYAAIQGSKRLHWLEDCVHSEGRWERTDEYRRVLREFLVEVEFI